MSRPGATAQQHNGVGDAGDASRRDKPAASMAAPMITTDLTDDAEVCRNGSDQPLASASQRSLAGRWCGPLTQGSLRGAVMALASTAFGSGVLSLPWVFATLGLPLGMLMLVCSAFISWLSQRKLANAAYATQLNDYADIVRHALGQRASGTLDAVIFLYTFGSCVGYFVFMSQFGPPLLTSLHVTGWLNAPSHVVVALALFPGVPLCLLRTLGALRYASLLNVVSLILVAIVVISCTPSRLSTLLDAHDAGTLDLPEGWWWRPHLSSWQDVPRAAAICFFSYCCHISLFQKYRELEAPTTRRVNKVLVGAVGLEMVVYTAVGICGFASFGLPCAVEVPSASAPSCTPINILASPQFTGTPSIVARLAMIAALVVCVPVNLIACRAVPMRLLGAEAVEGPNGAAGEPRMRSSVAFAWHLALSMGLLFGFATLAIVYPNVTPILGILGGGCAVTFMFTFPLAATLVLYFGGDSAGGMLRGAPVTRSLSGLGDRGVPGTPQIGRFLGLTRTGVIVSALMLVPAILLGYTSAGIAVASVASGK